MLEGAGIKTREMKEIVRKEYLRQVKLLAKSKLWHYVICISQALSHLDST